MDLLPSYPMYVQQSIPVIVTHKKALTHTLHSYITTDVTTGKSFQELGELIAAFRSTNYLRKKLIYESFVEHTKKQNILDQFIIVNNNNNNNNNKSIFDERFSQFNDPNGYDETLQPSYKYLSDYLHNRNLLEHNRLIHSQTMQCEIYSE